MADPADSPWTSHRAYLGLVEPPPWLPVERGLALCGFDASARGRLAFHEFVCAQRGDDADGDGGDGDGVPILRISRVGRRRLKGSRAMPQGWGRRWRPCASPPSKSAETGTAFRFFGFDRG